MATRDSLTAQRLREVLHYDPSTGIFTCRVTRGANAKVGSVAGALVDGYVRITVDRVAYRAHRLAWLYVHGVWPDGDIDHRDRVRDHNWIDNLRPATQMQNSQNRHAPSKNNKSGHLGVCWHVRQKRWRVQIGHRGRVIWVGEFRTKEAAIEAREAARVRLHEFSPEADPEGST